MKFFRNRLLIFVVAVAVILVITVTFTSNGRTRPALAESTFGSTVTPIQRVFYATGEFFRKTFGGLFELRNLKKENEAMKAELEKLKEENRKLYQAALENKRLRELLDFKESNTQFNYIAAYITGKDPGNWFDIFTINKGYKAGVEVNDSVVTGQGLVGRVIEAGPNFSKVMSLIDESSSVSIIVNRTRDIGIVSGTTDSGLTAIMPLEADIVKGDVIITSEFSSFPKGLYVGKVESVEKEEHKLQKKVIIEPAVDFKRLEEVFVIKKIERDK